MTMLSELLPDAIYLTWLDITPSDKVSKLPETKDKLCPDAVGCHAVVTVAEVIPKREWEFAQGRKSEAVAIKFKTKTGMSKPLILTSQKNAWSAMKLWGTDQSAWIGQKCTLFVAEDHSPKGGKCCCLRMRGA